MSVRSFERSVEEMSLVLSAKVETVSCFCKLFAQKDAKFF